MKKLRRVNAVRLIKVSPFSMLVGNGDTLYAGHTSRESNTGFASATETKRYQFYFVMERYSLPDCTHYLLDLKPRFQESPSTSRDDLDAVMDAVCGESPAVEEAGTALLHHQEDQRSLNS